MNVGTTSALRIEARDVVFDYPGVAAVRALDGASLAVHAGELVALLGPNGSGKSTLLRVLAGLLRPRSGHVAVAGRLVHRHSTRALARAIAVVPQELPALPELLVADFVLGGRYAQFGFWRVAAGPDHAAVERALDRVGASDLRQRSMTELSGGQRQRVLVARALAQNADVVLFDEPTASLDPEHQILVMELIRELTTNDHRAVVVVTHDFNLASQFADRVVLLAQGRNVAAGSADEVLCADVLAPIYGSRLFFGRLPPRDVPLVVAARTDLTAS